MKDLSKDEIGEVIQQLGKQLFELFPARGVVIAAYTKHGIVNSFSVRDQGDFEEFLGGVAETLDLIYEDYKKGLGRVER